MKLAPTARSSAHRHVAVEDRAQLLPSVMVLRGRFLDVRVHERCATCRAVFESTRRPA